MLTDKEGKRRDEGERREKNRNGSSKKGTTFRPTYVPLDAFPPPPGGVIAGGENIARAVGNLWLSEGTSTQSKPVLDNKGGQTSDDDARLPTPKQQKRSEWQRGEPGPPPLTIDAAIDAFSESEGIKASQRKRSRVQEIRADRLQNAEREAHKKDLIINRQSEELGDLRRELRDRHNKELMRVNKEGKALKMFEDFIAQYDVVESLKNNVHKQEIYIINGRRIIREKLQKKGEITDKMERNRSKNDELGRRVDSQKEQLALLQSMQAILEQKIKDDQSAQNKNKKEYQTLVKEQNNIHSSSIYEGDKDTQKNLNEYTEDMRRKENQHRATIQQLDREQRKLAQLKTGVQQKQDEASERRKEELQSMMDRTPLVVEETTTIASSQSSPNRHDQT